MDKIKQKTVKKTKSFKQKTNSGLITKEGYDLSDLNKKELGYFKQMYPKSGVLFLTSKPGIGKSAIQKSIAKKITKVEIVMDENDDVDMGKSGKLVARSFFYIDLRLAMLDETDVGLFPDKKEMMVEENGKQILKAFLDHIVPKWAFYANNPPKKKNCDVDPLPYCGTIIHFEELNRAPLSVRNAALQILLDRNIGFEFSFNDNVFMVATGNLGDEDGTDVECFDTALNGRLIHIEHTLTLDEWIEYWAKDNIQPIILKYLSVNPEMFYRCVDERDSKEQAYASPRTWHFMSDYITANYSMGADPNIWLKEMQVIGNGYVGSANFNFLRYVKDVLKISIKDIINRYPELKSSGITFSRDKKSELLQALKEIDLKTIKENQLENCKLFLLDISDDELAAFILYLVDTHYEYHNDDEINNEKNKFILSFLKDDRFEKHNNNIFNDIDVVNKKNEPVAENV